MTKIDEKQLKEIKGGASTISGSIINAFTNIIKVFIDAGIGVGSALRRVTEDKLCPIDIH